MIRYPKIIAHRCGGALAMENSLAGLLAAKRTGCRAVEFDVMLTADRIPILMHDVTLDRTTLCRGEVAAMTLDEIRACDPRVPTLSEAIGLCERLGLWVNVELKPTPQSDEETGAVVGNWLARHWHGQGVISSFSEKAALAARQSLLTAETAFVEAHVSEANVMPEQKAALAARHELPRAAFALLCDVLPTDWQARMERLGAVAVHLNAHRVEEAVARQLGAAGVPWAAWTVDEAALAERMFALGAAAIFTDRPERFC
ncbi:MAG: glycerophosphodiester phosphodiesterase family protein [Rhodocyclaceae bacterium]